MASLFQSTSQLKKFQGYTMVLLFMVALNGCLCANKDSEKNVYPAAAFIFGDSLVDAGNNNYIGSLARANYGANGVDFPGGKATGRFCNGRTVADIIGQYLGIPFGPVFLDPAAKGKAILRGLNYASGGAGILDFTGYNFVNRIPMWEQIDMFRNTTEQIMQLLGPTDGAALIKNSMYSVTMGSNDYLNNYLVVGSPSPMLYTPQQFQDTIINSYRQQLTALVKLGARKYVLTNVGPLGCIPYRMTILGTSKGCCVPEDNELVSGFNTALKALVDELNDAYPTAKFVVANSYNVVMQIIENPAAYGFTTKDQACCGMPVGLYHGLTPCFPGVPFCKNRKSHLFWDSFHPTDAANAIISRRFFSGSVADIYPMNVKQLAALQLGD
ncbi:hypothetical protein M758_6G036300 [Ceratodon purpureus]|uniref:Uncharacterized protein n=1 Tax=Ceratodon purpureus TaxID=3225 RepID=A0A8T0HA60_CERPU|nr:hypothetical protein KC19_6G039400 [Ceratodon purpureus]KAG0612547.1 hypothetical protein M758_6G036300 [Ceratodon purpureus]